MCFPTNQRCANSAGGNNFIFRLLFICILLTSAQVTFSQTIDSTRKPAYFFGAVTVTNNGISLIPTFSLGKPAAIVNLYMGKGKFSFEPDLRISLKGKPWSFIFWARYKAVTKEKFRLTLGAHPALNFRTSIDSSNGSIEENSIARRYFATEISPNYFLTKNISVGIYYLRSWGLDPGTTKNTNFLTFNANFSHIPITKKIEMRLTPQIYYLKMDNKDGFYITGAGTLSWKGFPLALGGAFNKIIQTEITGSKDFVWNASLIYSFGRNYLPLK